METVTDRVSNPFGMQPDCERFVPGYGDANADFHLIGDHPGVHGGIDTHVPFTDTPAAERLQRVLRASGLLASVGDEPEPNSVYLSYLHPCVPDGEPTEADYTDQARFVDAEVRAITAHILLPVGERATRYVLETYTAQAHRTAVDMPEIHASEIRGAGWLVYPIRDPREWESDDDERLIDALTALQATDYRRESDLGRFLAGDDPYLVR